VLNWMVLRQDITEAKPIAIRRLSKQQAVTNDYDFTHTTEQQHDIKSFSGTPSHHALAAGKVLIEFTQERGLSTIDDWEEKYRVIYNDGSSTIASSTQQLAWTYSDKEQQGFLEINSKGTQGLVGFSKNKPYVIDDLTIQPLSPYSVIFASAESPQGTLESDREVIVRAIARAHNINMEIVGELITNTGEAPVILEPVKATLRFKREGTVHVLDHDGIRTRKTYPLIDGGFNLNTEKDKTIHYLISFE
jgi:hypothetical protein